MSSIVSSAFAYDATGIQEPTLIDANTGTYKLQDNIYDIYPHVAVCVWEKESPHGYLGTFNIYTNSMTIYFSVSALEYPSVSPSPNKEYVFRIGDGYCNAGASYAEAFVSGFGNFYASTNATNDFSVYPLNGMEKLRIKTNEKMTSVYGFTPANGMSNVGSMFIMPIVGGGIMLFSLLLPWIIGLAILSAFVYFAYRAFRFYKH